MLTLFFPSTWNHLEAWQWQTQRWPDRGLPFRFTFTTEPTEHCAWSAVIADVPPPPGDPTSLQGLHLQQIERLSHNSFDGAAVVADLRAHPYLWVGAVMPFHPEFTLRDIVEVDPVCWHVDTLWLRAADGRQRELEQLAARWQPDTLEWQNTGDGQFLKLWWD